jgi:hypothetical protein
VTPSPDAYKLGLEAIRRTPDNPEHTMMVALTMKEYATVAFGTLLMNEHFPELAFIVHDFLEKLEELAEAQEFLTVER